MSSLKRLRDLTKQVNRWHLNRARLLNNPQYEGTKVRQLYDLIHDQPEQEEEAIRQEIYGETGSQSSFSHLKRNLDEILISTLFLIVDEKREEYRINYDRGYKRFAAMKLLLSRGSKAAALDIAEEALRDCQKYELTELCYLFSFELLQHYLITGDEKRQKVFEEIYNRYNELYRIEMQAELLYSKIAAYFARIHKVEEEDKDDLLGLTKQLIQLTQPYPTYRLTSLRFNAQIVLSHLEEKPERVIVTGEDAIAYFDQLSFPPGNLTYFAFLIKMVPAYILLRQFEAARAALSRCLEIRKPGGYNWQVALIYQAINALHARQYTWAEEAFELYLKYDCPSPNLTEQWRIIEAYLYILDKLGRVQHRRRFKLGKFLNEVPIFSRDKLGANVSILVAQIFIYLINHQRGKIIDRIDALKAYAHKHLRRDYTYRSNCFIKTLMQLPISRFHPVAFRRKAKPYLDRLQAEPLALGDIEIELIPYEDLWAFLVEAL